MAKSNFIVRGGANFNPLYQELNKTQKKMNAFQSGISKTMKGIGLALGGLAVGKLIKDSIGAASQLEGAMLGLESIVTGQGKNFEKATGFINDYIKDGLVPLTDAVTAYKNLSARGYDDEQIKTTMNRLKDAASFGRQASYSLGEAVRTATEGLKNENSILVDNAGVTKNVSKMWQDYAKSIGTTANNLTQQQKIQAEVNGIMEETQFQVGDAAKYTETFAGKLAALRKTLVDIKVNLGNAFMPIANIVIPLLQKLANYISYITGIFAAFTQALFGKSTKVQAQQVKQTQAQAGAVGDLGDSAEKAGKQAKRATAGFDELNVLSKADGGSSGGAGGVAIDDPLVELNDGTGGIMESISTTASEMATKVKEAFTKMKDTIIENKDIILPALGAIAGALAAVTVLSGITSLIDAFKRFGAIVKIAWAFLLVVAAIGALIGALVTAYLTNDKFKEKVDALWAVIKDKLTPVLKVLGDILLWVWNSVIVPLGKIIIDVLVVALNALTCVAKWLWEYVLVPLGNFITQSLVPVLIGLATIVGTVVKVAIEALIKVFEFLWYSVLKPIVLWLGSTFKPVFESVGEGIKTVIGGLQTTFNGLINFITGVFTGDWEKAWEGVKQVFGGIFDSLYGLVKAPLSLIIKAINKVIEGVNKFKIDIPPWAAKIAGIMGFNGGSIGFNIPKIPELAKGGITDGPMLAMIGDNPGGKEVVSPLDGLLDMIVDAMSITNNGGSNINLTVKVGEDTIGERAISYINDKTIMTGESPILI